MNQSRKPDVTIVLRDGEINEIEAPKGLIVLVKNYDQTNPDWLDGIDERGVFSHEWFEGTNKSS